MPPFSDPSESFHRDQRRTQIQKKANSEGGKTNPTTGAIKAEWMCGRKVEDEKASREKGQKKSGPRGGGRTFKKPESPCI